MTPAVLLGAILVLATLVAASTAQVWTPFPPTAIDIAHRLAPPGGTHPLGTDPFGRDVLSLLMAGAGETLGVSVIAVGLGAALGVPLGLLAAARGGWADRIAAQAGDVIFAFPVLLTAIMLTALAGPGASRAMVAIGVFNIPVFLRVTRAAARPLWRREFVLAARSLGRSPAAITLRHILPNILPLLVVQATLQFALAIVADAGLAYVGLGAQPPAPSWGRMLNDAQSYLSRAPWLAVFPGLAIAASVLGLGLIGDWLRDRLDPAVYGAASKRSRHA